MLTSASAAELDLGLRLWRACIPPTLLYGLRILPLTAKLLGRLQAVYTRHLRAVSKSQAHLTFESGPRCMSACVFPPSRIYFLTR